MTAITVNAGGDVVSVGQFYAAMYWGFVLSTSFVGISLVQGYLYFKANNRDRWSTRALVISLLIFDPATSFLMAETIYYYFVVNFGVVEALGKIPISWVIENGLTVLVTTMVQVFFASQVYLVNSPIDALPLGRTAPALVIVFALVAFAAGTARTISIGLWSVTSLSRISFQTFVTIEESCALASDLLSSACLCYMLALPQLDSLNRSEALKTLFVFTINRAILMSIIQIGVLSSYLSARNCLYWMPFHLCKSKLYTNTLLAMLNSRSGGGFQVQTPLLSMPVVNLVAEESAGTIRLSIITSEEDVGKVASSKRAVGPIAHRPANNKDTAAWIVVRGGPAANTQDDQARHPYQTSNSGSL